MSMIGAQYDARFGLPSKIVLISGSPNAKVLCAPQNVAATASPGVLFSSLLRKRAKSETNEPKCSSGSRIRRATAWLRSNPSPFVKALQNAFHTDDDSLAYKEHHRFISALK